MEEVESILEDARLFTTKRLNKFIEESRGHGYHSILASQALDLPLRWRMSWLEARWFIDVYEKYEHMNPFCLNLPNWISTITSNTSMVEQYRSWTRELGFARDRLMENFFWTVGVTSQPVLSCARKMGANLIRSWMNLNNSLLLLKGGTLVDWSSSRAT